MTGVLLLLRKFWPYIAAFSIGMAIGTSGAWTVQGLRLTHAEQEFTQYKQDQKEATQKAKDDADQQREKASKDYAHLSGILDEQINSGVVFRRCVAAGRCGLRLNTIATCSGIRLPAAVGVDGTGTDAISALAGTAAPIGTGDPVVNDCALTTLRLNQLQTDIESQPGYGEAR